MQSTVAHRCPVCAVNMRLSGAFAITFAGGRTDYALKYTCSTCHVEMNRTEKTPLHHCLENSCHGGYIGDRAA